MNFSRLPWSNIGTHHNLPVVPRTIEENVNVQRQLKLTSWTSAGFSLMIFDSKYPIFNVRMLGQRSRLTIC